MEHNELGKLAFNSRFEINDREVFLRGENGEQDRHLNLKKRVNGFLFRDQGKLRFLADAVRGGTGVWIPFVEKANVYGFLKDHHTWAASGPFSGCVFEVGVCGNRVYAAHLSRLGGNDPNIAAWERCEDVRGRQVLFSQVIGVYQPNPQFVVSTAAIVVASIDVRNRSVSVTRMNVLLDKMNGQSGRIMEVKRL